MGRSPLMLAADPLLAQLPRLRAMPHHADLPGLAEVLVGAVKRFDADAHAAGLADREVVAARYVLCAALDDVILQTPWGGGAWLPFCLLPRFHREPAGKDRVFSLLTRLLHDPQRHRALLTLILTVLTGGFHGRYRGRADAAERLAAQHRRLSRALAGSGGHAHASPATTAPVPAPERAAVGPWGGQRMMLLVAVAALALGSALWWAFQGASRPNVPAAATAGEPTGGPEAGLRADLRAGTLTWRELPGRTIVTLPSDRLFDSGSADVRVEERALLDRLAAALAPHPGVVVVSGHLDDRADVSDRFPSPWHLSKARADSVLQALAARLPLSRLTAEGRADTEPVDDNSSPAGRSRNRRVEVTLRYPAVTTMPDVPTADLTPARQRQATP